MGETGWVYMGFSHVAAVAFHLLVTYVCDTGRGCFCCSTLCTPAYMHIDFSTNNDTTLILLTVGPVLTYQCS